MRLYQNIIGKLIILNVLFCLSVFSLKAQVTQETASQNTAGGTAQSTSFFMISTIGQVSPPGNAAGGQYVLQSGFLSFFQDTLGDIQPPAAPMNLTVNPSGWTNENSFSVNWDFPESPDNILGIWYKIGLPPSQDEDGEFIATNSGTLNNISVDSAGTHTIHIWLQDINGNKAHNNRAEGVLLFDNVSPQIEHATVESVPVNTIININAGGFDKHSQLKELWLYYRKTGDIISIDSTKFSNNTASIQAAINTQRGTEYAITAKDYAGNKSIIPAEGYFSIKAEMSGDGGIHTNESGQPVTLHAGSSVNDYRIFSIPFELQNKQVSSVFEDDLGQPDDSKWLLFDINHGDLRDYNTIKNLNIVNPGKGFLLIANIPDIIIDGGAGQSPDLDAYNQIQLESGWNLIGNPFDFDIPLNNLSVNGELPEAWYLGSSGWQSNPGYLKKWEGIAVYTASAATLHILPAEGNAFNYSVADIFGQDNWGIQLIAKGNENTDLDNFIGVYNPETYEPRKTVYHEAPRLKNAVSLSISADDEMLTKEGTSVIPKWSSYIKPCNDAGYTWDLEFESDNAGENSTINFEQYGEIPTDLSKFLIDSDLKTAYDLEKINWSYQFKSSTKGRHFRILIGSTEFAERNSDGVNLIADEFSLRQNFPNPFNPYTTIIFTLPENNEVTLDIFNIMGQKIKSIINGKLLDRGYHTIDWDGTNNTGQRVASGIYIYRLKAGKFVSVKKAILSR
jgi:hypothetical protein